ncbi:hypothetical protein ACFCP7_25485 [Paenibacillus elgii]
MPTTYEILKSIEGIFPIPTPQVLVDVGTFDAATGKFTWGDRIETKTEIIVTDVQPHKVIRVTHHLLQINAVSVVLRFVVLNRQGDFVVIANNQSITAPANSNFVTINIGKDTDAVFTLHSGGQSFNGDFIIERPPIIGGGAFTIPALPVAYVYAPPQGRKNQNIVRYSQTISVGTKTKVSFSTENSTTNADFNAIDSLRDKATNIYNILGGDDEYSKAIKVGLEGIKNALGNVDTSNTNGQSTIREGAIDTVDTREYNLGSEPGQGPGIGDRIIFLRNAKIVWLSQNGDLTLGFLGAEEISSFYARQFQEDLKGPSPGRITRLKHDIIKALLNLDPFIIDPRLPAWTPPNIRRPRFVPVDEPSTFSGSATDVGRIIFTHQITTEDLNANVMYNIEIEDHRPGWLSFLGIGEEESRTNKTVYTSSSSSNRIAGQRISVELDFTTESDEVFRVKAYYDRVFGTVAFWIPNASNPSLL